jgi:hypothetical protein
MIVRVLRRAGVGPLDQHTLLRLQEHVAPAPLRPASDVGLELINLIVPFRPMKIIWRV